MAGFELSFSNREKIYLTINWIDVVFIVGLVLLCVFIARYLILSKKRECEYCRCKNQCKKIKKHKKLLK